MFDKTKQRLLSFVMGAVMCVSFIPSAVVSAATVLTENKTGTEDGYDYELWKDTGNTSMTLTGGGTFSCEWNNINNALFRKGKKFDCTKTYDQIGNISIDFACDYQPNGNSYLCVYGWTKSPLIEYYIVESWGSWRPPGAESKGTITVDGGTYDVYQTTRVDQPSIEGDTTFEQYWSVRTTKRDSGTISVSQHFAEWEKMGMKMGNLYEAALNVEGYQSSGSANVYKNEISIGGEITDPEPLPAPEPDANGYYFHSTFESGTDKWDSRGSSKVAKSSDASCAGSSSLFVSGRQEAWNGTAYSLDANTFVPGNSYSFSAMVMQNTGNSEDMSLTLQYTDASGKDNYVSVATASAEKGVWTKLENTSFKIPSDAKNMLLYIETPENLIDFYVDEAIGAVEGVKNPNSSSNPNPETYQKGDVNHDKAIDVKDIAALKKYLLNIKVEIFTEEADLTENGIVDVFDLCKLVNNIILANTITPPSPQPDPDPEPNPQPSENYMDSIRDSITANVPSEATTKKAGVDYGRIEAIQYYSTTAEKYKKANVLLPAGYNTNEKYPVMYVNHGIFGNQDSMLDESMKIQTMAGNLAASGEAEKMIIVFTSMFTSKTLDDCTGFTVENTTAYDNFLYDITDSLMPYIESNYSVATGRENTAISGFSMGGRETLYIGISRPDVFGYIGAACPAPGVTPATDSFMQHPGSMQESEFRIDNNKPYVLLITGGTNDTVVGTFPEYYHNLFTKNGTDHIWQSIAGGQHDASCVVPMMYNYLKSIFKN